MPVVSAGACQAIANRSATKTLKGVETMNRLIRVAVVAATSLLAWPDLASACICPGHRVPSSPAEYRQWLDSFDGVVFRGTVVSVRNFTVTSSGGTVTLQQTEYTFKVERVWKGVTTSEVVIRTSTEESMCGIPLMPGKVYLIAADAPRQTIGLCSSGYEATRNEKDFFSALGEGSPPPK